MTITCILQRRIPFAICGAALALSYTASWAQDTASTCNSVSSVQRRIVEHADQGMGSLRSFVEMTRYIYGVDMNDVRESLDAWRAAVECQKQAAQAGTRAEASAKVAQSDQ